MTTHLVIPDSHAHPDFNNNRFTWLGNLVADLKPDHVVMLGDWADMPSLCSYDKGTKGFEGRRYKKDVASAIDAQEKFFAPIRARKKKLPKFWMLEGNHEYRIKKAINSNASQLEGIIGPDDLQFSNMGWEYIQYEGDTPGHLNLDGIAYAHYHISGVLGRPIGGIHGAYQLLMKGLGSCTQGHVHTLDYCIRTGADGKHRLGLIAGVYQDYMSDFAGVANKLWWKGVVYKREVQDGMYDPQFISLDAIRKEYR